jgi:hypothetical protein
MIILLGCQKVKSSVKENCQLRWIKITMTAIMTALKTILFNRGSRYRTIIMMTLGSNNQILTADDLRQTFLRIATTLKNQIKHHLTSMTSQFLLQMRSNLSLSMNCSEKNFLFKAKTQQNYSRTIETKRKASQNESFLNEKSLWLSRLNRVNRSSINTMQKHLNKSQMLPLEKIVLLTKLLTMMFPSQATM